MASTSQNLKEQKTTGSQGVDPKSQSKMNVTHESFTSGEKVEVTKEDLEHKQQIREVTQKMNFGRVFARIDKKEAKDYNFQNKDTGEQVSGTSYIVEAEMPVLGLVKIKDKDLFNQVEDGKSYFFDFRLENKESKSGTYISYKFLKVHHLPQFDKKVSPEDLMGQIPFE